MVTSYENTSTWYHMVVWTYIIVYIINCVYEHKFWQLARFSPYIIYFVWGLNFSKNNPFSSTSMFLWIFISLKPKLAVQLFTEKKRKTRRSMIRRRLILFSFLRFLAKIVSWKIAKGQRKIGSLIQAYSVCSFYFRKSVQLEDTRATESFSLSFRIDSLRRARVKCKYRVCA